MREELVGSAFTLKLLRFAVGALRTASSTVAVVALLRQQWFAGAAFSLAWLLFLAISASVPQCKEERPADSADPGPPAR